MSNAAAANDNARIAPFSTRRSAQMAFAKAARAWKAVECYGQIAWTDEQIAADVAARATMQAIYDQATAQEMWITHDCARYCCADATRDLIAANID